MRNESINLTYVGRYKEQEWYLEERTRIPFIKTSGNYVNLAHDFNREDLIYEILSESEGGDLDAKMRQLWYSAVMRKARGKSL